MHHYHNDARACYRLCVLLNRTQVTEFTDILVLAARITTAIMKRRKIKMKIKFDKSTALTVVGGLLTIGSVVIGAIQKEDDLNKTAEKAAEILKNQTSEKN